VSTSSDQPRDRTLDGDRDGYVDRDRRDLDGDGVPDRRTVVAREKEEHGGIKWGSAFFGWLTAAGTAILVTALLSAIGAAIGLGSLSGPQQAQQEANQNAETIGIVGAVAVLVVLFIAYYAGGYVAGRMARFDGAKQGLAVWLWALVIAIVVAIIVAVAGSEYNVLSQLNSLPRVPIKEGDLATGGIITAVAAIAASLGGAILGGLAGMRFHRKVDRTGLGA
jgi:magnesium-transporting ATPase (P-type)